TMFTTKHCYSLSCLQKYFMRSPSPHRALLLRMLVKKINWSLIAVHATRMHFTQRYIIGEPLGNNCRPDNPDCSLCAIRRFLRSMAAALLLRPRVTHVSAVLVRWLSLGFAQHVRGHAHVPVVV
ncbi:hypothetical protein ANCDUO_13964, partial [Ancylostoma duodenale]